MDDKDGNLFSATTAPREWVRRWLPATLGALLFIFWIGSSPIPIVSGPIIAVDLEQMRANTPLPVPHGGLRIQQSFRPRWDGLLEIELILARSSAAPSPTAGRLYLQLLDDSGTIIAEEDLDSDMLTHNQVYTFRFPLQSQSAGRKYLLQISGNSENVVSPWGYGLDVYRSGQLTLAGGPLEPVTPQTAAKDLRFVTRYQLSWGDAVIALGTMLYHDGPLMLLALLFIPLPGVLLLLVGFRPSRHWDPAAWWGTAFALGTAGWPLLWFGLSLLGGRWRPWSLWTIFISGWVAALVLWRRRPGESLPRVREKIDQSQSASSSIAGRHPWKWHHLLLILLLLLALALRLLAVRDIAFPLWVDSSRHGLITAVMAEQGRVPADYSPFLPVERFPYHFGFHTLSASLMLMSQWPLPRLLLFLGQLLNGLLPLTLYTAGWLFTRRREPGLLAAFWVAIPFFFPAYYATWGRMTQLTAMLLLPVLLALTWLILRGGRRWRPAWWLVGLLAAGLFLVHFRVFFYYLPFAALVWLISFGRNSRWLAAATGLALLMVGPRILQLTAVTEPASALSSTIANYNAFPTSYLQVGWERQFVALAAVGLILTLLAGLRRRRWTILPLTLAVWVSLLFLSLAGQRLGLPETALFNLNSMYISLFLPLALFLGITLHRAWRWLRHGRWLWQAVGGLAAGSGLVALLLYGARQQIHILNLQTELARPGDLAGLAWAKENLPDTAYVAVNSWLWLGNTWAGSDGGAWLVPLTGRQTTTPPIDHIYDQELFQSVTAFNESAAEFDDWSRAEAAAWLREQGVTHIFIGVRGGFFDPAVLLNNPALQMVYSQGGVFIFALKS